MDTSVLIKWFHSEGEGEVAEACAIRDAHVRGDLDVHVLDLAMYEVGNVLIRGLGWSADDVADQLDDLVAVVGTPMVTPPERFREASHLAERHALSFYDACWAAAAVTLGVPLVTADRRLTAAGLAETATATTTRLNLELPG